MASFLEAHKHGGRWQVRIEDIDPPREVPGSAQAILQDLERLDSDPITKYRPTRVLADALRFLGQTPPPAENLAELWDWAFAYWDIDSVPRSRELVFETSAL